VDTVLVQVTVSDEELLKSIALRDEAALIELHRRYAPCLTATLLKLVPATIVG
jgi:hypothetical protein